MYVDALQERSLGRELRQVQLKAQLVERVRLLHKLLRGDVLLDHVCDLGERIV